MKGLYKRIISGVLVLVTMFLMCSPVAFASSEGSLQSYQPETFWGWLQSVDNSSWNFWKSLLDKDICPKSPNTNGRHEFVKTHTTVDGKTGYFYVCKHCGKSAGEVGEEAYQQQVGDIQNEYGTVEFGSNGFILPIPVSVLAVGSGVKVLDSSGGYPFRASFSGAVSYTISSERCLKIVADIGSVSVAGLYTLHFSGSIKNARFYNNSGSGSDSRVYSKGDSFHFPYDSSVLSCIDIVLNNDEYPIGTLSGRYYFFVEPVTYSVDDYTQNIGGINSRPTVIDGGNYGIIGDNGQITTITDNRQIINEGDNLYYNPATGQTYTITDWTYNYDGRIYNITLDTGDKVSVEYGDENITITENTVKSIISSSHFIWYSLASSSRPHIKRMR